MQLSPSTFTYIGAGAGALSPGDTPSVTMTIMTAKGDTSGESELGKPGRVTESVTLLLKMESD
jgi:hypothetical protein